MSYALHYWGGLPGRGEYVRLVLEDAGVSYTEISDRGPKTGFPVFAPPVLVHDGDVIGQMPNICAYLAERHGLAPDGRVQRAQALALMLTVGDVTDEVHDTHHPIAATQTYEDQRDAAILAAKSFTEQRLPGWLKYFERVLDHGDGEHLIAGATTFPDLGLHQLIRGLEYAFPNALARCAGEVPKVMALHERVGARPNLVAYRASDRCRPFNETGIFRKYPELDP